MTFSCLQHTQQLNTTEFGEINSSVGDLKNDPKTFHPIVSDIFSFWGLCREEKTIGNVKVRRSGWLCTCGFFFFTLLKVKQRGGGGRHEFLPPTRNSSFLLEVEEENSFFFVGGQFVWQSATTCQEHGRIKKTRQVPFFSSMTHFLFSRNRKESNLNWTISKNWTLPTRHPKTKENQISFRIT